MRIVLMYSLGSPSQAHIERLRALAADEPRVPQIWLELSRIVAAQSMPEGGLVDDGDEDWEGNPPAPTWAGRKTSG